MPLILHLPASGPAAPNGELEATMLALPLQPCCPYRSASRESHSAVCCLSRQTDLWCTIGSAHRNHVGPPVPTPHSSHKKRPHRRPPCRRSRCQSPARSRRSRRILTRRKWQCCRPLSHTQHCRNSRHHLNTSSAINRHGQSQILSRGSGRKETGRVSVKGELIAMLPILRGSQDALWLIRELANPSIVSGD